MGAGCHQISHALDLYYAHTAGAGGSQLPEMTEDGNLYAGLRRCLQDRETLGDRDLTMVDRQFYLFHHFLL